MKTLVIKRDNRQYQCEVTRGDFFGEANVTIKEILYPDRKFMRTEVLGYTKTIDLDAYNSILEGVEKAVDKYHAEKTREERIKKCGKNLRKRLDKSLFLWYNKDTTKERGNQNVKEKNKRTRQKNV